MRVVVDSNVFVSALVAPRGTAGILVRKLVEDERTVFLISPETMGELRRVLTYSKIVKLLKFSPEDVNRFLSSIEMLSEEVDETLSVSGLECRDPDDIKFLAVAMEGRADFLITGDEDLLVLGKIEEIPVVTPSQYLSQFEGNL